MRGMIPACCARSLLSAWLVCDELFDGVQTYVGGKRLGGANYAKGIQKGKSGFVDEAVLFGVDWRTISEGEKFVERVRVACRHPTAIPLGIAQVRTDS